MTPLRRSVKRALAGLLGLIVVLLIAGYSFRAYSLREMDAAINTSNGIDEAAFAKIGGIDQWVTIRGQNRDNPVLLFVHGGPGFALLSLNPRAFLSWERDFTLVQWDQRGAGKTYGRSGSLGPDVTIDRIARDGVEVAEWIAAKLHRQRIILIGLSWGSVVGIHMVRMRPDLFSAYVGTGQIASYLQGRRIAYTQLLAEARARGDRRAVEELEQAGPPPYDSGTREGVHAKWATAYEPGMPSVWDNISMVLFRSPITFADMSHLIKGMAESEDHFRVQLNDVDLGAIGTDFQIPIFVFQGSLDNIAPVRPVAEYMDRVTAPHKALILIPGAGHNVMLTKSDAFLTLLRERVRPLAIEADVQPGALR